MNWREIKLIYVAGKYSGNTTDEVYENIQLARRYAQEIWRKGHAAICPHLNTMFMDENIGYEHFLRGDFKILSMCHGIFLLPNWKDSKGAKMEYDVAIKLGKHIYTKLEEL